MMIRRSILAGALAAVAMLLPPTALATPTLYANNCTSCHSATVTTCNGCHAHGTHPDSSKSSINVTGTLNKTSFAPGETVSVTINGGYRTGWIRAILFNQNLTEIARSSCPGGLGGCTTSVYPATLTAPAPTTPGTYTWAVAWYGNQFDISGASFGSGTSTTIQPGFFTPDTNNASPPHGWQTVAVQAFTVAAPTAPSIALSPPSLTFPTVTLGGTAMQTTQIENTGPAPLNVTAIALCAGTSSVFSWTPAAPLTVPPGGSTTLTVTYAPLAAGTNTGCLAISSNDATNPTVDLGLTGTAVAPSAPAIALNPTSLSFGNVTVGSTGTMTTMVQNTGNAPLNVTAIALCTGTSTEFAWSPSAPFTVGPGMSATLTVTFTPTKVGSDTGCLALTSNAPTSPTQLQLSGAGVAAPAPSIALSPASLDFGTVKLGTMKTLPVAVQNHGNAPLDVTSISLCEGTSTAFTWTPAAPFTVAGGAATTLMVTFTPTAAGTDSGCIAIASNDPVSSIVDLAVTGTGAAQTAPSIALVPSSLDFGMVTVGSSASRMTEVQNAGTATLNVTAIALCSGTSTDYGWAPSAPLMIAPGGSATLTVTFAPTSAGVENGCLAISSDDPVNATTDLALSGTGVPQAVSGADIDPDELEVPFKLDTRVARSITPVVEVENEGSTAGTAPVTVVGRRSMTSGTTVTFEVVYAETISVTLAQGAEAEVRFDPYAVETGATGIILWTATVTDQDADVDRVTAKTFLAPCLGGDDIGEGGDDLVSGVSSCSGFSDGSGGGTGGAHGETNGLVATTSAPRTGCSSGGGGGEMLSLALLALVAVRLRRRSDA